jgi:hypothetical protein
MVDEYLRSSMVMCGHKTILHSNLGHSLWRELNLLTHCKSSSPGFQCWDLLRSTQARLEQCAHNSPLKRKSIMVWQIASHLVLALRCLCNFGQHVFKSGLASAFLDQGGKNFHHMYGHTRCSNTALANPTIVANPATTYITRFATKARRAAFTPTDDPANQCSYTLAYQKVRQRR